MKTVALIAAAGFPGNPDSDGPMDKTGAITAIERIVATLRNAGISSIVIVTGHNSEELERLLASNHVVFLKNHHYGTTDMLESVKIGLRFLKGKFDRILFTIGDVPFFTSDTVKQLLASKEPIVVPYCDGEQGHPVLFSSHLTDFILDFKESGGLQAALHASQTGITFIQTEDRGIFHTDLEESSEEYQELLKLHNQHLVRVNLRVGLAREKVFFDEQVSTLLMLIDETGNVREACKHMHISYTTSWNLIQKLEQELHCQMVSRAQGGARGSHSELTPTAREFLHLYSNYMEEVRRQASRLFEEQFKDFFRS
ncbi:MAG: NTP transferase domain-containing protein [Lachnospiraceae bacterium]|nr:NTP transferase domain-containing protein [Lachnospiraceae bacterium]